MSQIEKLLKKFEKSPQNVRYVDIEKILFYVGFEKVPAKGSHVKWKHRALKNDIIVPVHNKECKNFYKQLVRNSISDILKK